MSERPVGLELVIPYFGARHRLEETVRSVLAQDSGRWRLLVVEDGDQGQDAGTWLASLADPRVGHVVNPRTLGIPGNFQRCLDLADAAYVAFVGCDDRLRTDYVSTVLDLADRFPTAVGLVPNAQAVGEDGRPVRRVTDGVKALLRPRARTPRLLDGESLLAGLLHGNWTYFPATAWRRDAVAAVGFRQDLPVTLDLALLADLFLDGGAIAVTDHVAFEYRRHAASASSAAASDTGRFTEEAALFAELDQACRHRGWGRASRAAAWHLTSRAHAALRVPGTVAARRDVRPLLRHVVAR
jgi:glycosyltransferase involved in cell wall biosynthesis